MLRKNIPNTITILNLLMGTLATINIMDGNLILGAMLIAAGAFFDFFDGLAARLLKVASPMGKELDSLADLISFGLAPTLIAMNFMENAPFPEKWTLLDYLPLLLIIASALRLAKFNIDTRQSDGFLGMPTPANAMFWLGLIFWTQADSQFRTLALNPWFLCIAISCMSLLMVSEVKLIGLKFKNLAFKENAHRFAVLISSLLLFIVFRFEALPFVVVLYLIISIIYNYLLKR